jgi:uncharacterized protein YceK
MRAIRLLVAVILAVILAGCGTVPTATNSQTAATTNYAQAWITALQAATPATAQTVQAVCANSSSAECGYAKLASGLLPLVLGGAQAAIAAYQATPTPATEAALSAAMEPVYDAAKKVAVP